jgi:hypothetical protein
MADAVIGALRVILGADTAALDKGLKQANSSVSKFAADITKIAAGIKLEKIFTDAINSIVHAVKKGIEEADKLGKAAQKIGVPIEELSALRHAAELSDVSLESLTKGLERLSKAMTESLVNPTGQSARALRALEIELRNNDGTIKTSVQVLSDIAGKFEGLKDGAGKTAIAMQLFGRAGADLIPLLNTGKRGIEEMKQEARDLGIVIDSQTAKSAETFQDNLKRLGAVLNGIITQLTAHMAPGLAQLSTQLVQAAKDTDLVKLAANGIIGVFSGVIDIVTRLRLEFALLSNTWSALKQLFLAPTFQEFTAAWQNLKTVTTENDQALRTYFASQELAKIGADAFGVGLENLGKRANDTRKEVNFAALGAKNAVQSFIDATNRSILTQQAELATIGLAAGAKERLRIITQGLAIAQQNKIPITTALKTALEELGNKAADAALKLQGQQLVLEAREPHEKFREEMTRNQQALIAFGATSEQVMRVNQRTAEAYGATWAQVLPTAINGFEQLAKEFGKHNRKIAEVAKALGIVEAIINTYVAFTKALASAPPPFNYVLAAGVLAAGLAKVVAIKSQQIPGAQLGGTFKVPGGISATDNRFVPLNLAAGERVEITPADKTEQQRPPAQVNITVPDLISRESMRKVFDEINSMIRDGYKINLAPA